MNKSIFLLFLFVASFSFAAALNCRELFKEENVYVSITAKSFSSKLLTPKQVEYATEIRHYSKSTDLKERARFQHRELAKIAQKAKENFAQVISSRELPEQKTARIYFNDLMKEFDRQNPEMITADYAVNFAYNIATLFTLLHLPTEIGVDGNPVYSIETLHSEITSREFERAYFNQPATLQQVLEAKLPPQSERLRAENYLRPEQSLPYLILGESLEIDSFNLLVGTKVHVASLTYQSTTFDGATGLPKAFLDHDIRSHRPSDLDPEQERMLDYFVQAYQEMQPSLSLADAKMLSLLIFQDEHERGTLAGWFSYLVKHSHISEDYFIKSIIRTTALGKDLSPFQLVPRIKDPDFYGNYIKDVLNTSSNRAIIELAKKNIPHFAALVKAAHERFHSTRH